MLSFDGNTAPYLQYAYSRIQSLFAKAAIGQNELPKQAIAVDEPERRLAVCIAGFNDVLQQVADEVSSLSVRLPLRTGNPLPRFTNSARS